jgi:hypothetical protein
VLPERLLHHHTLGIIGGGHAQSNQCSGKYASNYERFHDYLRLGSLQVNRMAKYTPSASAPRPTFFTTQYQY